MVALRLARLGTIWNTERVVRDNLNRGTSQKHNAPARQGARARMCVEMPGVEPGSEVESPKPTTCVFNLWGLAHRLTD